MLISFLVIHYNLFQGDISIMFKLQRKKVYLLISLKYNTFKILQYDSEQISFPIHLLACSNLF